ncbi:MAG: DUF2791 family P-loop domain-containing protein [Planctomycetes bacterium]|nr:DUF2791 family P-loop domain-containing protein [Planctomycetota bacterium]MCB9910740.1 DUF2791 family P-loop domain-containing protein [Planctomycetota bacterium]MCB9912766.1 DUF2791 family P-loop domain-containing protein [Planctomycetota bacterium]HPF15177.1 DUF2791 family P-loop domain-containing protein [Planctomycetota bacterium]HRV82451.1 DUF2791 family P-loop domain-containing protein [Planctomycetota bacterium]
MDDLAGLSARGARSIVERMGETGQPPERGALAVNVGTEEVLEVLRQEYLIPIREDGRNSSFKLVQATFGGGKTHFLHCLREIGWREGFLVSLVGISPQECPFDDTLRVYQAVAKQLELPPTDDSAQAVRGVEAVLARLVLEKVASSGEKAVRTWLTTEFRRAPIESHALRRAVYLFLLAVLDGDDATEEILAAYLRGDHVSAAERGQFQLREELDSKSAFRFLRSLIQVMRELGVPGLILLFDEMDRVMSLSVKRRKAIGDNLRQMIDHCGQATLPALLWVYAVPPEFMTTVVPEYPALEQRLRGAGRFSLASPLEPVIDLEALPLEPEEFFGRIGQKLLQLFQLGRPETIDMDLQTQNVALLADHMALNALESGSRRIFVKRLVHMLHGQIHDPKLLKPEDLERMEGFDDELEGEEDLF